MLEELVPGGQLAPARAEDSEAPPVVAEAPPAVAVVPLAVALAPEATAEHPHPRPAILPGTFRLLVVEPAKLAQ